MAKVHYIPQGYHTATPYLLVRGAAEAIEFYKNVFGATEIMRTRSRMSSFSRFSKLVRCASREAPMTS